jgi:phosphoglycolate phosphatase
MRPADLGARAPRFPLIVFDWDGTLVDSTALIVASIREACRAIGATVPDEEHARHVIGLGLHDALHHVVPDVPPARYPELSARYREYFIARDAEIPLFDGMRELLVELEARGHLLAIATGKSRHGLERALEQQQIGHHFAATRCADEGFSKPHPDMLLHLLERTGVPAAGALMIGDTTHDLELARNAGTAAVAVTYGAHTPTDLATLAPLGIVDSVAALRGWLAAHA